MSAELALLTQIKGTVTDIDSKPSSSGSHIGEIREFDTPLETFTVDGETWLRNGNSATSSDALAKTIDIGAWTEVTENLFSGNVSLASNGTRIVVVKSVYSTIPFYSSDNGLSWLACSGSFPNTPSKVVYGNGVFVMIGSGGSGTSDRLATSNDGIAWTLRTSYNAVHNDIACGNGKFVVALQTGSAPHLLYSSNGITWATTSLANATSATRVQFIEEKGLFIAIADNNEPHFSNDGVNWTAGTGTAYVSTVQQRTSSIFYFDGYIYTAYNNGGRVDFYRSQDGVSWVSYNEAFNIGSMINIVNINNMLIIMLAASPYLLYSPDFKTLYSSENAIFNDLCLDALIAPNNKVLMACVNKVAYADMIKGFALPFDDSKKYIRIS